VRLGQRALVWTVAAAISGLAVGVALGHTSTPLAASGVHGYDVSWPQCDGSAAHHMPAGHPSYVILGLTDGVGHTVNPCLGSQLGWARSHGVRVGGYLVASYPTRQQRAGAGNGLYGQCGASNRCRLRNDGAAQAKDALATMKSTGLAAPMVWIDVEFRHTDPWSHHNAGNAAVIQGIVRGLSAANMPYGVYTTSHMWTDIVGKYRVDAPNWLPVGHGGPRQALTMCQDTATGGVTWLVQYTRALDSDQTCPVLDAVPIRRSPLWPFRKTTLTQLSRGDAVRAVQQFVGVGVTGAYDAGTAAAVDSWEQLHHVPVTGKVAPYDWQAMGANDTTAGHTFWLSKIVSPS
jgi:peptidoglycan hydrolase-like protein with peptidoglycan-binding domain